MSRFASLLFEKRRSRIRVDYELLAPADFTIWIDASRMVGGDPKGGVARVVRNISTELEKISGNYGFEVRYFKISVIGTPIEIIPIWASNASKSDYRPGKSRARFRRGDVIASLDLALPPWGLNRKDLEILSRDGVRTFCVAYDDFPHRYPYFFKPGKDALFRAWLATLALYECVFFISDCARKDVNQSLMELGYPPVTCQEVFPLGTELRHLVKTGNTEQPIDRAIGRTRLTLVAVGTIEPRKGYGELLDAFEILWGTGCDVALHIVGKYGWNEAKLLKRIQSHEETNNRLRWYPSMGDIGLEKKILESDALISNSYAEGFGLPLAEAIRLGIPIFARNLPVFQELFGDIPHYFRGKGAEELASELDRFIEILKAGFTPNPLKKSSVTWAQSARTVLEVMTSDLPWRGK